MPNQGLAVSRVVDVQVSFAPLSAIQQPFSLLILGDSGVIDGGEGMRSYNQIDEVAGDFGTTAPEYYAAALYFSQIPRPNFLFIGQWAATATAGRLTCGPIPLLEQGMNNWTSVANGGFTISVDGGTSTIVSGINLSNTLNLNGVATAINTAMANATPPVLAVCKWTGTQFTFQSTTTGITSMVSYLSSPGASGTDLSAKMYGTSALAERSVYGMAPETPVAAVARLDGYGWYALMFASTVALTDSNRLAISGYIEAAGNKHIYGITTAAAACLDSNNMTDIGSICALADYMRTTIQYSLTPHAIASFLGRALGVNYEGSNTTITMKLKVEPGVIPELLSAHHADTLQNKRINVYVQYNNGTSILQEGVMSGRAFFDEMTGLDWLSNRIQNDMWNVLYQSPKIPQTDPGVHVLVCAADGGLSQGVTNGLIAPGRWNAPGFGQLNYGDLLASGWYTFADSVDNQPQSIREQRIAPLIQIAVKLAGAVHFSDVLINVNR
jgi:Protein of unknown function (DUF3383)